jgi:hypothetical protein
VPEGGCAWFAQASRSVVAAVAVNRERTWNLAVGVRRAIKRRFRGFVNSTGGCPVDDSPAVGYGVRMRTILRLGIPSTLLSVSLFAGCTCERSPAQTSSPPVAEVTPPVPRLPPELLLRLAGEREERPTGTPLAQDVFTALQGAGLRLDQPVQHLGAPFGARYCSSTKSEGLRYTVCEYHTEEAADEHSHKGLTPAAGAKQEVLRNGKTLLWVLHPQPSPETETEARRAATAFESL